MHFWIKLVFFLIFNFWAVGFYGQNVSIDTIKTLDVVRITSDRLYDFSGGQKHISLDSNLLKQYAFQSVSDLLIQQTTVNVKTYGAGMISMVGIRGNAPQHTAVFWNGININASNIGMSDFSLLPVFIFDKIEMQYGGGSAIFGSGTIGGSFHLFSEPLFSKMASADVSLQKASFGELSTCNKIKLANKRIYSSTAIIFKKADNDFEYVNEAKFGKPVEKMQNAAVLQKGLLQDISFKINDKQKVSFSAWLQNNERQIPGTMTTGVANAVQYDKVIRSSINWDRITDKNKMYFLAAGIIEKQHFIDTLVKEDSQIDITNYIMETGISQKIKKNVKLDLRINNTLSIGNVEAYINEKKQNKTSFVLSYNHYFLPIDWAAQINIRYEVIKQYHVPVFPSFGLEGKIWWIFYGKLNISKNFRVPTMNDLYWHPGGNPQLLPEESLNEEITILAKHAGKSILKYSEVSLTAYHALIDNCIQWAPTSYVYWAPQNLRKVRSMGLESELKTKFNFFKIDINLNLGYAYTSITNINQISAFDESLNKQLIYVPDNKFFVNTNIKFNQAALAYNHVFTGKRYIKADNTKFLPFYNVGTVSISYNLQFKNIAVEAFFRIENLWNEKYQIIQWRPMPGRSYSIALNFKINNN